MLPLLLYSWQSSQLQTHPYTLSRRLLASSALGKILLPLSLHLTLRWKAANTPALDGSTAPRLVLCLLATCYFLFLLLSAAVQKITRQKQINTLCGDLNGKGAGRKQEAPPGRRTSNNNQQYRSLLPDEGEGESSSLETDIDLELSDEAEGHRKMGDIV